MRDTEDTDDDIKPHSHRNMQQNAWKIYAERILQDGNSHSVRINMNLLQLAKTAAGAGK